MLQLGRMGVRGNVQLGADGCFSYRHIITAGDGPIAYEPAYFLPKDKVDRIKQHVAEAKRNRPAVTREAVDGCEQHWEAANEKKRKADPKYYDASGIFVMTCRHAQTLFICNIDTPGEQHHYIIALVEEVASLLPPQATIWQAYDIGCVTDQTLKNFPILTGDLRERVAFVINAMHAFGHEFICQIVYNPRMVPGLGLTDQEGVERFWSRIRKLIPITRGQWNSRRIWTIDQYTAFINEEGRHSLGDWIHRQQTKNLPKKHRAAVDVLQHCGVAVSELRRQWEDQKTAQMSVRRHAVKRLRRDLDKVLALQVQIDGVDKSISEARHSITESQASRDSMQLLVGLETTHEKLSKQADALYASLNIQDIFPALRDLPLDLARLLLTMRDLKMNIRRQAVGSFFEWETLDRAVSGRREPLGTKLYQATRHAITRRQPALLKSINKFNNYCAEFERLRPPNCRTPVPRPLSTQLSELRDDPALHEDVWVTPSEGNIPRWLDDEDVRQGIQSIHAVDRCVEEDRRLGLERVNMWQWLEQEFAIARTIETAAGASPSSELISALTHASDPLLALPLQERRELLEDLRLSWGPALRLSTSPRLRPSAAASTAVVADASAAVPTTAAAAAADAVAIAAATATTASAASLTSTRVELEEEEFFEAHPFDVHPFSDEIVTPEEVDAGVISDDEVVFVARDNLTHSDDEEETSTAARVLMKYEIDWQPPALNIDTTLLQDIKQQNDRHRPSPGTRTPCAYIIPSLDARPNLKIDSDDLNRLRQPTRWLNNFCVNGVAAAFQVLFGDPASATASHVARCAALSTLDLHRVRYNATDAVLWHHLAPTKYWEKSIWLIPIHRRSQAHWVLIAVSVVDRTLYLFDSYSQKKGWDDDLPDVMTLITRMVVLANRNHHTLQMPTETWIARPLFEVGIPRQTNGHDCGVWVLCMMAAILRGYGLTGLSEREMLSARQILTNYICTLPSI
ncbi:hypothetical protein GGX14DRAFT_551559 [Mycena pura]|uniref:Ubiquitin-like protease family profile domain-containing protein n=1 Tax=Mycena pura TaxID=153505 RepID=A0AAD6V976_9AGAR|nr:hypothetical protein GGX14DRAFT_551559 [Mycena pura]